MSTANYLPILYFAAMGAILPVAVVVVMALFRPHKPTPTKLSPYECGVAAPTDAYDHRFSVRYYLIAVLFVVFDVETIFLFPWALAFNQLTLFAVIEAIIFILILVGGLYYAISKGALEWQ